MARFESKGFSIVEILVTIAIMGVVIAFVIPRFNTNYNEAIFSKDVAQFVDAIGQAQAMAIARNSNSCTSSQQLRHVNIERVGNTSFKIVPYCIPKNYVSGATPTPATAITYTFEKSQFASSAHAIFALFYPDSTADTNPPGYYQIQMGSDSCRISVNEFGVIEKTDECP